MPHARFLHLFAAAAFSAALLTHAAEPPATAMPSQSGAPSAPSRSRNNNANLTPGYTPMSAAAAAKAGTSALNNLDFPATDPGYRLSNGDAVAIIVWGEGEVSTDQRIDNKGVVRVPLVGDVKLTEQTVREAEGYLERMFVDKKLLRKPMVSISVRDYASREVFVLGAVNAPGKFPMPPESSSIEIVDLITSIGGFRPTAKADDVKVTRLDASGIETVQTVNVEAMISGRGGRSASKSFLIYAGDRIYVPERLF